MNINEQARILQQAFNAKSYQLDSILKIAIEEACILVENSAKINAPVDKGLLRKSINHRIIDKAGQTVGLIGTNVEYACIFGSNTIIKTIEGNKRITDIVIGDMVLTQTGEYRKVLNCITRPAKEVPDLVTIKCEYRKGRFHTITTTKEHKFIAYHDGRNKWIEAGNLSIDDLLFSMKKPAHNKGNYTNNSKICIQCGKNPLENVFYQVCNPHTDSYVNMDVFHTRKIVSIKHHRYEKSHKNHAMSANVYDLTVDTIHSYYANGILVSNSYVEFGTGIHAEKGDGRKTGWFYVDDKGEGHYTRGNKPHPFLRPALTKNRTKIKEIIAKRLRTKL